jgi:acyl-CoA synthetase (NDP forming)
VIDAAAACGRRGIAGAVVFASGFAEVDDAGRADQEKLAATARTSGVRLIGPNCLGYTNFIDSVPLTFEPVEPRPLGKRDAVGVVAQSGALGGIVRMALLAKGVGVSHAISTGNEADLTAEDFVAFLLEDARTRAVALFVEQFRQPQRMLTLADRARELGKPIVLMHPGESERARSSAATHTGALTGNHAVMAALLRHRAVLLVDTLEELFDTAEILVRSGAPRGGVGILTNSGAMRGFSLDFCERIGLDIPTPSPQTLAALRQALPSYAPAENPADVTAQVIKEPEIFTGTAQALLADPAIGSLAVLVVPGAPKQAMDKVRTLLPPIAAAGKPAIVAAMGDEWPVVPEFFAAFRDADVPVVRSPERALRALANATVYGRMLRASHGRTPVPSAPALPNRGTLPEYAAKAYFAQLGIPVPKGALARNLSEARTAAAAVGYPLVLKAQAASLAHKTDAGGVALGIEGEPALTVAWRRMQQNFARRGVTLDGMLVEAMARGGIEMIVGARRDPDWGPVVMVGLGGVWIEALHDVRLLPPDLPADAVIAEIGRLKGAAVLRGLRGAPPADMEALARVVTQIGGLMRAREEIMEIDINPLSVLPRGEGVLALDALIVAAQ